MNEEEFMFKFTFLISKYEYRQVAAMFGMTLRQMGEVVGYDVVYEKIENSFKELAGEKE